MGEETKRWIRRLKMMAERDIGQPLEERVIELEEKLINLEKYNVNGHSNYNERIREIEENITELKSSGKIITVVDEATFDKIAKNQLEYFEKKITKLKGMFSTHDIKIDRLKEQLGSGKKSDTSKTSNDISISKDVKDLTPEPKDDTWILKKRDGTKEIYGAKYFTLVRTEDLEWMLGQLGQIGAHVFDSGRWEGLKEKYILESEK